MQPTGYLSAVLAILLIGQELLAASLVKPITRPEIITKHNIRQYYRRNREKKSSLLSNTDAGKVSSMPKPFVVTTSLNVHSQVDGRQGRTWMGADGVRVIEGVRMPDDESDRVTWRNGRIVNNVFTPYKAGERAAKATSLRHGRQVYPHDDGGDPESSRETGFVPVLRRQGKEFFSEPEPRGASNGRTGHEVADQAAVETSRDYMYHAGATETGRPVYYVVEEPENLLHSDRSPYTYEPADTQTSITQQVADYTQNGVRQQQPASNFVIKEHTYSMCPGCPTFSIPVPIPKDSLQQHDHQHQHQHQQHSHAQGQTYHPRPRNMTFLERVGNSVMSTVHNFQHKAMGLLDPVNKVLGLNQGPAELQHTLNRNSNKQSSSNPLVMAGMAAAALGGMALLSSAVTLSTVGQGRALDDGPQTRAAWLQEVWNNLELVQELEWDRGCVLHELCSSERAKSVVLEQVCASRQPLREDGIQRCREIKNQFRLKNNHRLS